jgi:hypothetical protein
MSTVTAERQRLYSLAALPETASGRADSGIVITLFRFFCYLTRYRNPEVVILPADEGLCVANNIF